MKIQYDQNMIDYINDFANPNDVKIVNDYLNSLPPFNSKDVCYLDFIPGEHDASTKVEDPIVIQAMRDMEQSALNFLTNEYFPKRNLKIKNKDWSRGLELIRWSEFAALAAHADGSSLDPKFPTINMGCLIYLNDEYNGGEIKFNDYDLVFTPKPADLVIFPNHYIHEVLQVLSKDVPVVRRHTMPIFYSFTVEFIDQSQFRP
jgi:hypothetical protein